ncbi:Phragmoplast orienting kinesin-1 [Abeliophyllum distichum]|uniref:Phragmoplast orienting kinesin-1 n=1 Tax=Abeliophyllum distichum TaxID=126358 RepID=A0ABD1VDF0_9LAMI
MNSDTSSATLSEDRLSRKLHSRSLELAEALRRIRVLEAEKAVQAKEIEQIKDYISELVLHSEAQASQYQQKYKNLEKMVRGVKTDVSIVTSEAAAADKEDKSSTRTRRSSSPFRCIASLVQQMNAEKDQEMLAARLRIKELEALAASWQKEVCMLNTRLAIAESMTHDVIRDLLSVKLDITNYANMIDQNQLQKLVEETLQQRQEFITMEHEICNLRGQINDLLEERERCISEERDQLLTAQNNLLKRDKTNLQKRVTELDDMVKKLFGMHNSQPCNQPQTNSSSIPHDSDLGERLAHSQKVLSRINNQLAQYRRLDRTHPQDKLE